MISQGVIEQGPFTSRKNGVNAMNSGGILETNTENLLRMVIDGGFKLYFLPFHPFIFTLCLESKCSK